MSDRTRRNKTSGIPTWSWAVAALGLVLVGSSAGFMLFKAFVGDASPPQIEIDVVDVSPSGDSFLAEIRATNRGGTAAAGVVIEGALRSAEASVETSTITLDYVPSGSQIFAGLYFARNPREFDLQVRAKGYEQP